MGFNFGRPCAVAHMKGWEGSSSIDGTVSFFRHGDDVLVVADVYGLPHDGTQCNSGVFGFHIHEGTSCCGTGFPDTMGHYNPGGCEHPFHAGDLPPLFECGGHAFSAVLTGRFKIHNVIGRTVVIHGGPDDFTSQPSGNSGEKIACGVIRAV